MTTQPALPIQADVPCPDCLVWPGEKHELSCPEVSPALFAEFLAWQTRMTTPAKRRWVFRRYVVTVRQPEQDTAVASRHITLAAAQRRAGWLRGQSDYADADVRARHTNDLEH